MANINVRPPTFSKASPPAGFETPSIRWMTETWHVTHSSLPMWKSKRNVRIQYTPLPPSDPSIPAENTDRLDDLVSSQGLNTTKVSTIEGIDTATKGETGRGEWNWRGKGWLKIAASHWEVLGWGEEEETGNKWVVTCFDKTLFTPAGVDLYSQHKGGLKAETVEGIKKALNQVNDEGIRKMAGDLFEVKIDDARE